ncbi:hypothetical protein LshimejAT787_0201850 [Lyophyllum shimeji]|uniref:Integrase catalytic domain-containing protein n=1 Tax=Lyophyllum shimeji TaxID=47721 RepID=A0A9P3PES0_LYOSH|nr:hypothetical protein LshimejAT787_0201850 [Lyophyllum shimeji]
MESHKICSEAQFIIDSLPNVELVAVERVTHQLSAICTILSGLEDPATSTERKEALHSYVTSLLLPLEDFIAEPPAPKNINIPLHHTDKRGRPSYILDLNRAVLLHNLGNTWKDIAEAMNVSRSTLYNHMASAGFATSRKEWSIISDDDLDERVAEISLAHPFIGSNIALGHLEAQGLHLPLKRVQESLRRVDEIGVLVRWSGIIKRRVYKVRGSNALWHHDGNEKLRPWGFWVHGCIDGHSRLILYLKCSSNKRASTVLALFKQAIGVYGWPSRARGDFGTENNQVEQMLVAHWGGTHRAYLRGRSIHNVRIERLWKDVRKDSLEAFRQIFDYLEKNFLLDMANIIVPEKPGTTTKSVRNVTRHRLQSMNLAENGQYRRGIGQAMLAMLLPMPMIRRMEFPRAEPVGLEAERDAGIFLNDDDELEQVKDVMEGFDFEEDDGNWGIDVYCRAVILLESLY